VWRPAVYATVGWFRVPGQWLDPVDTIRLEISAPRGTEDFEPDEKLQLRDGHFLVEDAVNRLSKSRIRISEFQIALVKQLPRKRQIRDFASE
jgi:hypothetical protein